MEIHNVPRISVDGLDDIYRQGNIPFYCMLLEDGRQKLCFKNIRGLQSLSNVMNEFFL